MSKSHWCKRCKKWRVCNKYWICRPCEPEWRMEVLERQERTLARKDDYDELVESGHSGNCDICGRRPVTRRLRVKYDQSGSARGLLCYACERGLACFRNDLELLESAVEFLSGDFDF